MQSALTIAVREISVLLLLDATLFAAGVRHSAHDSDTCACRRQ